MSQKAVVTAILFLFLAASAAYTAPAPISQTQTAEITELLLQGGDFASKGKWNESEKVYLKAAAQSSQAEERIQAYEGLAALYGKLRMSKKAARAKSSAANEKKFIARVLPEDDRFYETYTLAEGDTYAKIASRRKISLEWLKRANQNKQLIIGKIIRVPLLPYTITVNRNLKTLVWKRGEEILKTYPIAVGKKESETPAGEFEIISKVKHPVWYHLKLQIPPESPKNLLGPRWLGLNVKGYGIHGTRNPGSINYAVSHGCVRMYNRDVKELFEWIPVGTKVTIRDSN